MRIIPKWFPYWGNAPLPKAPSLRWMRPDASFRERADFVAWAGTMLNSIEGHALQAYLFAFVPQSISYRGDRIDPAQANQEYFRLMGYLECLSKLQEAARMVPVAPAEIEADYDNTAPPSQETS